MVLQGFVDKLRVGQMCSWAFLALLAFATASQLIRDIENRRSAMYGGVVAYDQNHALPAFLDFDNPRIMTISSSDRGFPAIFRDAKLRTGNKDLLKLPFGMFELAGHQILVVSNQADLIKTVTKLQYQNVNEKRPRIQYAVAMAAWLLGFLLLRRIQSYGPIVAGICGLVASSLVLYRCRTCPVSDTILGFDIAKIGIFTFGMSAMLGCWNRIKSLGNWYVIVCLLVGVTQLALFYSATHTCSYCLTIFAISAAYIGASTRPEILEVKNSKSWIALSAITFGLISLAILGYSPFIEVSESQNKTSRIGKTDLGSKAVPDSFVNLTLGELGIKEEFDLRQIHRPMIIVIGSRTCQPCLMARLWASQQSGYSTVFVNQFATEQRPTNNYGINYTLKPGFAEQYSSPTLLLVGESGKILESNRGWGESEVSKEMLAKRFADQLRSAKFGK
jgi:hypothetical protein